MMRAFLGDVSQAVAEVNSLFMDRLRATTGGLFFAPDVKRNRTEDHVVFHVTCTFCSVGNVDCSRGYFRVGAILSGVCQLLR